MTVASGLGEAARQNSDSVLNEFQKSRELSRLTNQIVHMFSVDFNAQYGLAFLVMELCQQDFEKYLRQKQMLSPLQRKLLWRQLVNIALILRHSKIVIARC